MKRFLLALLILIIYNYSPAQGKYEQPALISSAGQSADVTLAGMLLKKISVNYKIAALATENDLNGYKTLIIVPGYSSKGLGAAGISREQEMDRVEKLIAAAKKKKMRVLMMHIGGTARRGAQSDDFNQISAEVSEAMIVVKQGDEDKFFSRIASQKKIKISIVEKMADIVEVIKPMF